MSLSAGSGYAGSIEIDKAFSGSIYVRMTGTTDGSYSGNISHVSSGVETVNLVVSGQVGSVPVMWNDTDWLAWNDNDIVIFQ